MALQDIPDIEGDKNFGIRTFSVRVGQEKVSLKVNILFPVQERGWFFVTKQINDDESLVPHCFVSDFEC